MSRFESEEERDRRHHLEQLKRQTELLEEQLRWAKLTPEERAREAAREKLEEEAEEREEKRREDLSINKIRTAKAANRDRFDTLSSAVGYKSLWNAFVDSFEELESATLSLRKINARKDPRGTYLFNKPWKAQEFNELEFKELENFLFLSLECGLNLSSSSQYDDFLSEASVKKYAEESHEFDSRTTGKKGRKRDEKVFFEEVEFMLYGYNLPAPIHQFYAFYAMALFREKFDRSRPQRHKKSSFFYSIAEMALLDYELRYIEEDEETPITDSMRVGLAEKFRTLNESADDSTVRTEADDDADVGPSAEVEAKNTPVTKERNNRSKKSDKADLIDEGHEATEQDLQVIDKITGDSFSKSTSTEDGPTESEEKKAPKPEAKSRGGRKQTTKAKAEKEESSGEADDDDLVEKQHEEKIDNTVYALKPIKNKKAKKEESLVRYMLLFFFGLFANYLIFGLIASLFGKHYWPF